MHNAFLNIYRVKMSKSAGNFFTVREISEKYDLRILRFFMLSSHYRSPLEFDREQMEAAEAGLGRITNAYENLKDRAANNKSESMSEAEKEQIPEVEAFVSKFETAMDDDFNTADAEAAIFDLVRFANKEVDAESSKEFAGFVADTLKKLSDVLGLVIEVEKEDIDSEIEALIAERQAARKNKDFARADEIRNELLSRGIILKDTREGVKWSRA